MLWLSPCPQKLSIASDQILELIRQGYDYVVLRRTVR